MIKLGVIFGGMSTEHDVSIASGTSVIQNLDKQKYKVYPIYIDQSGNWYEYIKPVNEITRLAVGDKLTEIIPISNVIEYLKEIDIAFPVLHGLYGEDGTIQGMLELLKIPYVGCRVLGSSICMDKVYTKMVFEKARIPQAKFIYIKVTQKEGKTVFEYVNNEFREQELSILEIAKIIDETIHFPVFVKPSNSGSSVGVHKATNQQELQSALLDASIYDTKILLEEEIVGREVECAVLGNEEVKATCVGEVLSAEDFYTFEAKYQNTASRTVIPAKIEEEKLKEIQTLAIKAFKAVDGKGLSRVDFFIRKSDNQVYINEINTMPGFTQISMYPQLWEASGLSYTELLDKLIDLAY
ncbi:MAG: D-alanine--D-alanine ligase [Clostridia bacterium]|nr:D-alanine--D-alanine ligase [Clostridia bacterium]